MKHLTDTRFNDLVTYVSENVSHDFDRRGWRMIENREPIPYELEDEINYYAEEWCEDNGIDEDEYYSNYGAESVFMHDNYEYE